MSEDPQIINNPKPIQVLQNQNMLKPQNLDSSQVKTAVVSLAFLDCTSTQSGFYNCQNNWNLCCFYVSHSLPDVFYSERSWRSFVTQFISLFKYHPLSAVFAVILPAIYLFQNLLPRTLAKPSAKRDGVEEDTDTEKVSETEGDRKCAYIGCKKKQNESLFVRLFAKGCTINANTYLKCDHLPECSKEIK